MDDMCPRRAVSFKGGAPLRGLGNDPYASRHVPGDVPGIDRPVLPFIEVPGKERDLLSIFFGPERALAGKHKPPVKEQMRPRRQVKIRGPVSGARPPCGHSPWL